MQTISVREVNQHFCRYLHAVDHGEELIITKRGREVARMVPGKDAVAQNQKQTTLADVGTRLGQLLLQLPVVKAGGPYIRGDFHG